MIGFLPPSGSGPVRPLTLLLPQTQSQRRCCGCCSWRSNFSRCFVSEGDDDVRADEASKKRFAARTRFSTLVGKGHNGAMIVIEYRPNLAIVNVYLGFDQLSSLKQAEDFDDRLVVKKRVRSHKGGNGNCGNNKENNSNNGGKGKSAAPVSSSRSLCVLQLEPRNAGGGGNGGGGNEAGHDLSSVDLFSFEWPQELEPYYPCMGQMQVIA